LVLKIKITIIKKYEAAMPTQTSSNGVLNAEFELKLLMDKGYTREQAEKAYVDNFSTNRNAVNSNQIEVSKVSFFFFFFFFFFFLLSCIEKNNTNP
jgi:hypothetical protein